MIKRFLSLDHTIQGILFGLSAFLIWSCNDTVVKYIGKANVPFSQIIVLSGLGAISTLVGVSTLRGDIKRVIPNNMKLQLTQAVITIIMGYVWVVTFTQLPLTTVYTALFSAPCITAVLAKLVLKEHLGRRQLMYIIIGFLGSLFAVNPLSADLTGSSALGWTLLPLYPIFFAVMTLVVRTLRKTDTAESIAVFPTSIRLLFFLPVALWGWQDMTWEQICFLLLAGMLVATGNLLFTTALSKTKSAIIAPLHYSQIVYGALFGYLLWGDVPAAHTIIGSLIIVAAGVTGARLASRNENREREALTLT